MHGIITAAVSGQAAPTLSDLAAAIREAHAGAVASLSSAAVHALVAGAYLTEAKELSGHGRFGELLHACDVNDRTARQYMQLATLAGIKSVPGTDLIEAAKAFVAANLAGLSVKGAIKCYITSSTPKYYHIPARSPLQAQQANQTRRHRRGLDECAARGAHQGH
jgi:hypothetical protein